MRPSTIKTNQEFMKQIPYSLALLFLVMAFSMASCTKDPPKNYGNGNPGQPSVRNSQLDDIFSGLKSTPQTFNVVAGTHQVVFGAQKTRLTFYPNSFKDKNGLTITSGNITVQLTEIYKPGDMIGNRAPTTSNGKLLLSGGEVYVKAYRNGEEVYPNTYGIGFAQPATSNQPMRLFYGDNNNEAGTVNWTESSSNIGSNANTTTVDSGGQNMNIYYQFDSCTSFNWINCDYFYNSTSQLTGVEVVVPDTSFNTNNTMVFLFFPSINSATYFNTYSWGTHSFSLSGGYNVPVGMAVHIVSISNVNGTYYYSEMLNQTITNNMSVNISPQPQSLSYIQNALSLL